MKNVVRSNALDRDLRKLARRFIENEGVNSSPLEVRTQNLDLRLRKFLVFAGEGVFHSMRRNHPSRPLMIISAHASCDERLRLLNRNYGLLFVKMRPQQNFNFNRSIPTLLIFRCMSAKLLIELDGASHDARAEV